MTILKREFYFVRHGQTDHNILEGKHKGDHSAEIPLNQTGKEQATRIEPLIASLPIQTICASPMIRAQQTKELITPRLRAPHHAIEELGECTAKEWGTMAQMGMYSPLPEEGAARFFMDRVRQGINKALTLEGPILIVAHGGVHWATCCLMGIQSHDWSIPNCAVVHFSIGNDGNWNGRILSCFTI